MELELRGPLKEDKLKLKYPLEEPRELTQITLKGPDNSLLLAAYRWHENEELNQMTGAGSGQPGIFRAKAELKSMFMNPAKTTQIFDIWNDTEVVIEVSIIFIITKTRGRRSGTYLATETIEDDGVADALGLSKLVIVNKCDEGIIAILS